MISYITTLLILGFLIYTTVNLMINLDVPPELYLVTYVVNAFGSIIVTMLTFAVVMVLDH